MSKNVAYGLIEVQKDTFDRLSRSVSFPLKNGSGAIFLVAGLSGTPNADEKQREDFLDQILLHLEGLANETLTPGEAEHRFEDSMQKLNDTLKVWLENRPDAIDIPRSALMVSMLVGDALLVTGFGQIHSAFMHTDADGKDELHDIVRDLRREHVPEISKLFRHVMMGEFEPGDRAIFGNSAAFRLLPKDELAKVLSSLPAASAGEQLKLGAETGIESVVAVILRAQAATSAARVLAKHSIEELHRAENRTEGVLTQKPERVGQGAKLAFRAVRIGVQKCFQFVLAIISSAFLVLWGSMKTVALLAFSSRRITAKQDYHRLLVNVRDHLKNKSSELSLGLKISFAVTMVAVIGLSMMLGRTSQHRELAAREQRIESVIAEIKASEGDAEARLIYHDESGARTKIETAATLMSANAELLEGHPAKADLDAALVRMRADLRKEKTLSLTDAVTLPEAAEQLFLVGSDVFSVTQTGILLKNDAPIAKTGKPLLRAVKAEDAFYFLNGDGGILKVTTAGELKILDGAAPTDLTDATFWSSRLYGVNPTSADIVRLDATTGGFAKPRIWQKAVNDKLAKALGIVIDADVYIATPDEVLKYTLGVEQTWSLGAVDPAVHDVKRIWTSPETNSMYVLDSNGARVSVFSKSDGALITQYLIPGDLLAKDFAVDLTAKRLFLLFGSKVSSAKMD